MKKVLFFTITTVFVFAFGNINYTIKTIKPNINVDKNYIIVDKSIDENFVISPDKIKKNKKQMEF